MSLEQKANAKNQAEGFLPRMEELDTAVMVTVWNDIQVGLDCTSISLQDPIVSVRRILG